MPLINQATVLRGKRTIHSMPAVLWKEIQLQKCKVNKPNCYASQLKSVFGLKENASHVEGQNSLTPKWSNNMNSQLARDQVMPRETEVNLWASRLKVNDFFAVFSSFELRAITKHLMTVPRPQCLRVSGNQNSLVLFPLGPVIKCFLIKSAFFYRIWLDLRRFNWAMIYE